MSHVHGFPPAGVSLYWYWPCLSKTFCLAAKTTGNSTCCKHQPIIPPVFTLTPNFPNFLVHDSGSGGNAGERAAKR